MTIKPLLEDGMSCGFNCDVLVWRSHFMGSAIYPKSCCTIYPKFCWFS
ncbi:hypothetical protein [Roseofilum sp. Belize Diploria]|nr:hypothetical protein [Roseofilum sp. Belize Diploria]MBP0007531.1 hypothetical protein [Roseofilum sp. Belize Diploria]